MKKTISLVMGVCMAFMLGVSAFAEKAVSSEELGKSQNPLHYELPESWISLEIGADAATLGMVANVTNPDGTVMLQVFTQKDATLASIADTISLLENAENMLDKQAEAMPYIAYTIDSMRCFVIQVGEAQQLMLNFSVMEPAQMAQVDETAQAIIASITVTP